ncbi:hypothetical protein [Veronia nyctiphanis]|uniref:hypothetical protein n=1 Tax=Veronia nyctiphanis TaxID=1278244 RepID=UPI0013763821|nr:hypothetical protein [Veronia nyctiphanis]
MASPIEVENVVSSEGGFRQSAGKALSAFRFSFKISILKIINININYVKSE